MVHSEVLVGSHMILQTIHISSGWDSLSPLFPSSQDLPLPIKSLGLSSSEREEGKESGSRFLSEVGERREESNSTARGSHEATGTSSAEAQGTKGQEAQWPRVSRNVTGCCPDPLPSVLFPGGPEPDFIGRSGQCSSVSGSGSGPLKASGLWPGKAPLCAPKRRYSFRSTEAL